MGASWRGSTHSRFCGMHAAVQEQGTLVQVVPEGQRVTAHGSTKHIGVTRQGLRQGRVVRGRGAGARPG